MDVNAAGEAGKASQFATEGSGKEAETAPLPGAGEDGSDGPGDLQEGADATSAFDDPWKSNPIQIEATGHGDFVRAHENALVLLSGKRCHLCKRINREFMRAEKLARATRLPLALAIVNVENPEGTELMKRLNVGGLPVMFLNTNHGKERVFIDEWWAAEPLIADVQLKLGMLEVVEPVRQLGDEESLPGWLFARGNDQGTFDTAAILFTPEQESHDAAASAANTQCLEQFNEAARSIVHDGDIAFRNRPRFARVTSRDAMSSFGLPLDAPSIVVYKDFDDGKAIFRGTCTGSPDQVRDFVMAESTPRAMIVHHGNIKNQLSRHTNVVHVFVPAQTLDDGRAWQPILQTLGEVSRKLEEDNVAKRGEFMFFLSNGHQYRGWLKDYGLTEDELPAVGIDMTSRERRYAIPKLTGARHIKAITAENVTQEQVEEAQKAMATPDPMTGLMPEEPIVTDAAVVVSGEELAQAVVSVLDRKLEPFKHYGKKASKKTTGTKQHPVKSADDRKGAAGASK
jgi:hypothetical protein